ncbi:acyltransferase [Chloroflexales bacterium ZM16-3]|nr:acyltransferase [Chloroflexales bacterium ZM16-3]
MGSQLSRAGPLVQIVLIVIIASALVLLGSIFGHATLYGRVDQPSRSWVLDPVYELECTDSTCYRWLKPDAQLYLYALDGDQAILSLRLLAPPRPDGQPTQLTIIADQRVISPITVTTVWRNYRILTPTSDAHDTVLQLHSDPFHPGGQDTRSLGVALSTIQLTALGAPTPRRALFLILLPLLFWALARAYGVGHVGAFRIGLSLAALSGWAAADPVLSGYVLPTISWELSRAGPLLALLLVPPLIRWRIGHLPGGARSVVAIIVVALLSLRLTREVAGGLTLLLLGMLLLALPRPSAARHGSAGGRPTIPELTSIRFFAALTVVLFHYKKMIAVPALLDPLIDQGQASVGLFFILSGFVMTYTYADWFRYDLTYFRGYARARVARIVPLVVLALLVATPLVLWYTHGDPLSASPAIVIDSSWIANLLLIHVYVPDVAVQSLWNAPSWSVATEAFFYLLFPLYARFVLSRVTRLRSLVILVGICFGIEILTLIGSVAVAYWLAPDPEALAYVMILVIYKSPLLRIWEFLLGATLGALFLRTRQQPMAMPVLSALHNVHGRNLLLITAIGGILAVVYMPIPQGDMAGIVNALRWYVLYTPFFVLIIAVFAWGSTWLRHILQHPWLVRLGEASYALYIIHAVIHAYLGFIPQADAADTARIAMVAIIATILASLAVHQWVEVPMRRWLMGHIKPAGASALNEKLHT